MDSHGPAYGPVFYTLVVERTPVNRQRARAFVECLRCGAVVAERRTELHDAFHGV